MDSLTQIANELGRAIEGPVWHGPSLSEILNGVSAEQAAARPVPDAHSIWELVLHLAVWAEISTERLAGRALDTPPPDQDFPAAPSPTEPSWRDAISRLTSAYAQLAAAVRHVDAAALDTRVRTSTTPHSVEDMLRGVIEHAAYHGGQIALLKKALGSSTSHAS